MEGYHCDNIIILFTNQTGAQSMEIVYFTLVGIGLYFLSDWILERIEAARGSKFENRSIIFFVIILVLAVVSFQILGQLMHS